MIRSPSRQIKPPTGGSDSEFAHRLLDWYDDNRRILPWRAVPGVAADPYAVWLSEIMLQQTTVGAVIPYYEAFVNRWPTVVQLAAASPESVLAAWAGLGYYRRARNLHACARRIVSDFDGRFPPDEAKLRELPGIGTYTAAAIAAIAFGRRAVVVDGNVERVLARTAMLALPLPKAKPAVRRQAERVTPEQRAGDFAQAMMDLGAKICLRRRPQCPICPLASLCRANLAGCADAYPRRLAKQARPIRRGAAAVLRRNDGAFLVRTRPPRGLLGGMSEFPGTAWSAETAEPPTAATLQQALAGIGAVELVRVPGLVDHAFTHFALQLAVYRGTLDATFVLPADCRWVAEADMAAQALPSVMRKVAAHANLEGSVD
jgi:A/G-specific adenine glycosylase